MTRSITRLAIIAAIACAAALLLGASASSSQPAPDSADALQTRPALKSLQALIDSGDYKSALAHSSQYLQAHPDSRNARFLHAVALAGLGRNDDAIEAFHKLAEAWPERPAPANNLAALYARRGEYDKAKKWLQKALETQKVYAVAHRNLGDVYTALATMAYSRVLDSDSPESADVGIKLALVNHMYRARPAGLTLPRQPASNTPQTPQTPSAGNDTADNSATSPANDKPKPPPSSQQAAAQPQTNKRSSASRSTPAGPIKRAVHAWADAWSNQDYAAYVDFYTQDFPNDKGAARDTWLADRRAHIVNKDWIKVRVIEPTITRISANKVRVTFIQTYASQSYSDKVRKWLLLRHTESGWRIARETSTLLSRG